MGGDAIRERWAPRQIRKEASVDLWNSMAGSFGEFELPTFREDAFLKLLDSHGMLDPAARVLDVGLCCEDWHGIDLGEVGYRGRFDLVFARMTPAVRDAGTFEKLSEASHGWCVLSKPIRRADPIYDEVRALLGVTERWERGATDLRYALELLWHQGYLPRLDYEHRVWQLRKTFDEALAIYLNRIRTYRDLSTREEARIRSYLGSLLRDGFIHEDIDTTVATLCWRVDRQVV